MCQNKIKQTETSSPKHHGVHFELTTTRWHVIPLVNTPFPFPSINYKCHLGLWWDFVSVSSL